MEEIQDIVAHQDYHTLRIYLQHNGEAVLDTLYNMTRSGNLNTKKGKPDRELWQTVLAYYQARNQNDKVEEICAKLAEIEKSSFQRILEDNIIGIAGGIAIAVSLADARYAFRVEDRLTKYFEQRAIERYCKMLVMK